MLNTLLNKKASTGTGESIRVEDDAVHKTNPIVHTVELTITGSPTAVTVDLEGSLGGTNYSQLATHTFTASELSAGFAMFHLINKPVIHVQGNLTTLTGGASPAVTMQHYWSYA